MRFALAASIITHAAMLLVATIPGVQARLSGSLGRAADSPPAVETWAGTTAELPSGESLVDVQLNGAQGPQGLPPVGGGPAGGAAAAVLPSPPVVASPPPPPPASPVLVAKDAPAPKPQKRPAIERPARPSEPESMNPRPPEKPARTPLPSSPAREDPYEGLSAAPKPPSKASEPKPVTARAPKERPSSALGSAGAPGSVGDEGPAGTSSSQPALTPSAGLGGTNRAGGSFGAVGRAGVRDLGRAFTQAIPAASGSDPLWSKLPLGDAGTIRIVLEIDGTGRLSGWKPADDGPVPKHLANLGAKTFILLQSGTFAIRAGEVTGGRQTVQVRATVGTSDKPPPEGGEIELSHTFDAGVGKASFVQPGGREVTFAVRVLRVEVAPKPEIAE